MLMKATVVVLMIRCCISGKWSHQKEMQEGMGRETDAYPWKIGFRTSDAPRDDASEEPLAILPLHLQRSSRVTLRAADNSRQTHAHRMGKVAVCH